MAVSQFNTIPEANLPALAAGKSIAHIRAVDADGVSTSVTPAQAATALATPLAPVLAPMLGIDYSIFTEQLIPGEFFMGKDGTRKQVYCRTVSGESVWWWNEGNCSLTDLIGGNVDTIHSYGGMTYKDGASGVVNQNWTLRYSAAYDSIALLTYNRADLPLKHRIWIKYTKLI